MSYDSVLVKICSQIRNQSYAVQIGQIYKFNSKIITQFIEI